MFNQSQLLPGAISSLFATTAKTGVITLGDRYGLLTALTNAKLSRDEQEAIDRVLYAVIRGRFQLSTI
ncbi:hypothetical protein [Spirulina sp. 06S082]|uniref:hypothetical protein n=1 Tax=Spirulina sp. 06S082 TaxID=3110248 RepID=UPI002B21B401|nr:hypothetical protein [Spirulina sp. 06S082]MEA5471760.1 hypothetical protein [Spirulina sp. 06S082]